MNESEHGVTEQERILAMVESSRHFVAVGEMLQGEVGLGGRSSSRVRRSTVLYILS